MLFSPRHCYSAMGGLIQRGGGLFIQLHNSERALVPFAQGAATCTIRKTVWYTGRTPLDHIENVFLPFFPSYMAM